MTKVYQEAWRPHLRDEELQKQLKGMVIVEREVEPATKYFIQFQIVFNPQGYHTQRRRVLGNTHRSFWAWSMLTSWDCSLETVTAINYDIIFYF
jgi:hypothetical protein